MARGKPVPFEKLFIEAKQEEFLDLLRNGSRRGAATDVIFGEENAARRRELRDYIAEHSEFEKLVLDAEVDATEHVEEALYQAAISGSVPAAKTWLELQGRTFPENRGRPANPVPAAGSTQASEEPNGLYNVTPLDPRARRQRQSE